MRRSMFATATVLSMTLAASGVGATEGALAYPYEVSSRVSDATVTVRKSGDDLHIEVQCGSRVMTGVHNDNRRVLGVTVQFSDGPTPCQSSSYSVHVWVLGGEEIASDSVHHFRADFADGELVGVLDLSRMKPVRPRN